MADSREVATAEASSSPDVASEGNADAAAGRAEGSRSAAAGVEEDGVSDDGDDDDEDVEGASVRRRAAVEVVLARLLTDTLASLTRAFEKGALISGEVKEGAVGGGGGGRGFSLCMAVVA